MSPRPSEGSLPFRAGGGGGEGGVEVPVLLEPLPPSPRRKASMVSGNGLQQPPWQPEQPSCFPLESQPCLVDVLRV